MADSFVSRYRLTLLVFAVLLGFSAVSCRLVYLHILKQPEFAEVLAEARQRERVIPARRGRIVDCRGNLMAFTRTLWEVGVDPVVARKASPEQKLRLGELLGLSPEALDAAFREEWVHGRVRRWSKLASRVDKDVYEAVMGLKVPGVYGNPDFTRTYPGESLGAHIIGFVNRQQVGVTGVERIMDFYLRGQSGYREYERDGQRRELAQYRNREIKPRDGLNVELTLDSYVQHLAEEALGRAVEKYQPEGITIIISEPATGYILALANAPTFDPNRYNEYPVATHRNRALTDIYEPGSTFKIVSASAALEEAVIQPDDRLNTGLTQVRYRGRTVKLPRDDHGSPQMSMREVVVQSSNRGAAYLGMMLGEERLYDYSRKFGFGERTGLGLPGEVSGILHPVGRWDGLTITRLPMGHAISATPMQVHMSMSVLANDGILMEPCVVRRIFDNGGKSLASFDPVARRRVISAETSREMTRMLVDVVSVKGTARRARIEGFEVAGKTGTSQKIIDGQYSSRAHIASFSGFFPARQPRVVMTVVVDEPKGRTIGYGGLVAAPIFREVGEQLIRYFGIEPAAGDSSLVAWKGGPLETSP